MVWNILLNNIELILIIMIGSFSVTTLIILTIAVICYFRRKYHNSEYQALSEDPQDEDRHDELKSTKNAKILSKLKTVFHRTNDAFTIPEYKDTNLFYSISYQKETEKLALKIDRINMGGNTLSIKPHMLELKELFMRIQLYNNSTNSMINSELYNFNSSIIVNELFFFSLKEFQLEITTVVIDIFVTLSSSDKELLLGFVELSLPGNDLDSPTLSSAMVSEFVRPIDLYQIPVGYMCLSLDNSLGNLTLKILASVHYNDDKKDRKNTAEQKDIFIYYNMILKNSNDEYFTQISKTTIKPIASTVVWNEVFAFQVSEEQKETCYVTIELWKTFSKLEVSDITPEILGKINLGLVEDSTQKSQSHWKFILENKNSENFRWHPIHKYLE